MADPGSSDENATDERAGRTDVGEPPDGGASDRESAEDSSTGATDDPGRSSVRAAREVEVPLRVYKTVVVFTTMFSVALVVGGFVVLDAATQRARLDLEDVDPALALLGLAMIVVGAGLYAFATRFRASGMGKPKESGDESSNNG